MSDDKKIAEVLLDRKIISIIGGDFDCGIKLYLDDGTKLAIYPTEFLGSAMLGFRITKIQEIDLLESDNTLLGFIRGEKPFGNIGTGITSYIDRDDNNDKIHAQCLELEKQHLIYRHLEKDDYVIWKPIENQTIPQEKSIWRVEGMTMLDILLRLKNELETSINATNAAKQGAIENGHYQAAVDFEHQNVGILYAIALVNQEFEYLEDKE